jgi:undecaprenyl-diphosphatase
LIALLRVNFTVINNEVNSWAATIHTNSFTAVAKLVADGFDTTPLLILSLVIGAALFLMKKRKNALLLVGAMVGNTVILEVLKAFIYSPRPMNELVLETGNSFPSGHVTSTVVLFGLLTFFAWQTWKTTSMKAATSALFVTIVSLVGFTRIYLNVHWLSDVIGGYFLGAFWITFCIVITPYLVKIYNEKVRKETRSISKLDQRKNSGNT